MLHSTDLWAAGGFRTTLATMITILMTNHRRSRKNLPIKPPNGSLLLLPKSRRKRTMKKNGLFANLCFLRGHLSKCSHFIPAAWSQAQGDDQRIQGQNSRQYVQRTPSILHFMTHCILYRYSRVLDGRVWRGQTWQEGNLIDRGSMEESCCCCRRNQ
jgi:hypothetical protein